MNTNAIKVPFAWYDDIEKQNRYTGSCPESCGFKLLTPLNSILPFEIRTDDNGAEITSWKVYCADGTLADDITTHATTENKVIITVIDGQEYINYDGSQLLDGFLQTKALVLTCGAYYSVLETTRATYYSELFYAIDMQDPVFVQSKFALFTPWRWYDDQQKQNRFKGACEANCNFYLLMGNDALLPFMFRKPSMSNAINSWILRALDGSCEFNLDTSLINIAVFGAYDYIYYNGDNIDDLPCGLFESIITINGISYYSEIIKISNDFSTNGDQFYILQEDGFKILQETNFGLLQE